MEQSNVAVAGAVDEKVTTLELDAWQSQLQKALRTPATVNAALEHFTTHKVPSSEIIDEVSLQRFSFKITPYMLSALKRGLENSIPGAWEAFQWSFAPTEFELAAGDEPNGVDCIGEELSAVNPTPAITNFYKNRVVFRITSMCAAYCRYCFRRRMVGDGPGAWDQRSIDQGLAYIAGNPAIHEVILSGGDPLILSDRRLEYVLSGIKSIPHVRRVRFDTKALTMMPGRITEEFVTLLQKYQPCFVIGHFTHLYELTPEAMSASARLIDAGIPLFSHTPLLRGVNDDEQMLATLMEALVDNRIKPYYLLHFIPTKWTEHFRVPIARGLELMRHLQSHCDGLAIPTFIVYLPEAGGKVPLMPQYMLDQTAEGVVFETFDGRKILYREPQSPQSMAD